MTKPKLSTDIQTFRTIREEGCYYVDKAASHHPADMHMKDPRFGSRDWQETTDGAVSDTNCSRLPACVIPMPERWPRWTFSVRSTEAR